MPVAPLDHATALASYSNNRSTRRVAAPRRPRQRKTGLLEGDGEEETVAKTPSLSDKLPLSESAAIFSCGGADNFT